MPAHRRTHSLLTPSPSPTRQPSHQNVNGLSTTSSTTSTTTKHLHPYLALLHTHPDNTTRTPTPSSISSKSLSASSSSLLENVNQNGLVPTTSQRNLPKTNTPFSLPLLQLHSNPHPLNITPANPLPLCSFTNLTPPPSLVKPKKTPCNGFMHGITNKASPFSHHKPSSSSPSPTAVPSPHPQPKRLPSPHLPRSHDR
ncbi:hypothetical protein BC829DRAFT_252846 [Chytridium lagenaria]|nr:hypothetical protein BC829DRAFT_252846 [Chytridium lagenaria]